MLLQIENLHARAEGKPILRGVDLEVRAGEVHAVMGPNGSGKSTLALVLAGRESFQVERGRVLYKGRDLLAMPPEQRAREGLFLGFQYPVEIPGVSNLYFLKAAVNAARKHRGEPDLDAFEFMEQARACAARVGLSEALVQRPVNEGFSGGEKKKNEIFQMAMLRPTLAVLDETDSGLDIDAVSDVARAIESMRAPDRAFVLITHFPRMLHHVSPDRVHVIMDGRIVRSGGKDLAFELEERGYGWLEQDAAPAAQLDAGDTVRVEQVVVRE